MRSRYLVTYDICEPKRLRRVYATMRGFGAHMQYSVFRCDLSRREKIEMIAALEEIIHHTQDQVLLVDLGPPNGRGATCIESLGRPYVPPDRSPVVI